MLCIIFLSNCPAIYQRHFLLLCLIFVFQRIKTLFRRYIYIKIRVFMVLFKRNVIIENLYGDPTFYLPNFFVVICYIFTICMSLVYLISDCVQNCPLLPFCQIWLWKVDRRVLTKFKVSLESILLLCRPHDDVQNKMAEEERKNLKIGVKIFINEDSTAALTECLENGE